MLTYDIGIFNNILTQRVKAFVLRFIQEVSPITSLAKNLNGYLSSIYLGL